MLRVARPIDVLLADGLAFTGESPFGSCFQQAVANVMHILGLKGAQWSPGLAWGFSWNGTTPKLGSSGRWLSRLQSVSGVRIRRVQEERWQEARIQEKELLATGTPLVAGVDSFHIPSPHQHSRHLVHAVIVVRCDEGEVAFCDPMNEPSPVSVSDSEWERLRRGTCVDQHEMVAFDGYPVDCIDAQSVAATLAADVDDCRQSDAGLLEAFTASIAANRAGDMDVADVGAERLYAGNLLAAAAQQDAALAPHARTLSALARRWYLLHTLALESGGQLSGRRVLGLLADLAEREADARAAFLAHVEGQCRQERAT